MQPALLIRRMAPGDAHVCEDIDCSAVPPEWAWSWQDFAGFLKGPTHGGHVALWQGRLVGFVLHVAHRRERRLQLFRIVVAADWQRRRVGSRLVQHLRQWLAALPDVRLCALIHERHLALQCFLRANRFRAVHVCKGHCGGVDDAYLFELPVFAPSGADTSGSVGPMSHETDPQSHC